MIPYGKHFLDEEDHQAVMKVLQGDSLTQGDEVGRFEQAVADFTGARYAVAVSSGTAALHLACLAADVGAGDRVVTSPNTFVASANCAFYAGGTPEFADIDPGTLNMSPEMLDQKCRELGKVKVVIPVHFAGLPCDMKAISDIARAHGAMIIEDACHALGGEFPDGARVGSCVCSDMTVFSFHPVKHIAAGEGGMVTTNSEAIYHHLLRLRSHGINKGDDPFINRPNALDNSGLVNPWYYEMQELGFNFRITDIQSALGASQMKKLDRFVDFRRRLAIRYDEAFGGMKYVRSAQPSGRERNAHHLYVLRIDFAGLGMSRAAFMMALRDRGVGSQVHYIPVPAHPFYEAMGHDMKLYPNTVNYYEEAMSIPLYYGLTEREQALVINAVRDLAT